MAYEDDARGPAEGGPADDPCPEIAPDRWDQHLEEDRRAMASVHLTEELQHRCLRRLAEAWSHVNYRYLRSRLHPPSIMLHDGESRWGAWHPDRRLITISRRQVLCYTWQSALETLKHEVAHQVVSELRGADGELPHGAAFREACRLLACDPAPRGQGGVPLFRPGGPGASADPEDARLLRVQKLLALADNNPDEHEARAAFARASELMLRYNLDPDGMPEGPLQAGRRMVSAPARDYVWRHVGPSSGRIPHFRYGIAGILQESFFVQCIWVESYHVARGVSGHVLEVLGQRANVEMAEYVHDCLLRQCEALWRAFQRARGVPARAPGRSLKRQYLDGLLSGFRRQLRRTAHESRERGLVWVGDQDLERWVRGRHPRTSWTRLDGVDLSEVRCQGVQEGERLRLHRPVAAAPGGSGPRALLGG